MEEDEAVSEQEELARLRRWAAGEPPDEPQVTDLEGNPVEKDAAVTMRLGMHAGVLVAFDSALRLCGGARPDQAERFTLRASFGLWRFRRHWQPGVLLLPDIVEIYGTALGIVIQFRPVVVQRLPSRMPVGLADLLDPGFDGAALVARCRAHADRDFGPADRSDAPLMAPDAPPAEQAAFYAPWRLKSAVFAALRFCAYPEVVDEQGTRADIFESLDALRAGFALAAPEPEQLAEAVAVACEAFLVPDPAPERRPVPARLDLTLAELRDPGFDADALFARIRAARPPG